MTRRVSRAALVAVACLAFAGPTFAAERIDAPTFLDRIASARRPASAGASSPSPSRMVEVRARLALPVEVSTAWGTITIRRDPVLEQLSGTTARDFRAAVERLDALAAAAGAALARPVPDRNRVRSALERAYVGVRASPTLAERASRAIATALAWIASRLTDVGSVGGIVSWLVVAALAVGAFLLIRRLGLVPEVGPGSARDRGPAKPVDWAALAEEARQRGDLNAAARLHFRALIARLAAMGFVPDSPAVTAGDCRAAVAANIPLATGVMGQATEVFERAAYAHASVNAADVDAVLAARKELRR